VQLANEMQGQAEKYGLKSEIARVSGLEIFSESRWVSCADGRGYTSAAVILAGGSRHKKLNVPGEDILHGKGVFSCAFCDGSQFGDRIVAVVGGGDSGITEALYMAKIASSVILIEAMPKLTATTILQERVNSNPKITVRCGMKMEAITGQNNVEAIEIKGIADGKKEALKVDGVLVQIGLDPNTDYLRDIVPLDDHGQIVVNDRMETGIPLVLAAGDIRNGSTGQVATAVGDGTTAAITAIKLLQNRE
jgi:thioredoxin reductase (NADPH)